MTTSLLTPMLDLADATQVGARTWRKQILALRDIDYQGRKISFDKPFLTDLANAFQSGAYDQVPIVFAGDANDHNENPRNFGGEVKGLEFTGDGLDAIIELTEEGAEAVKKNPRLGVSARIKEGLAKSDGRTFPRAIRHVLLTMDPKITNLKPWQAVDLSAEDDDEVVDLTAATYKEDAVAKATVDNEKQTITIGDKVLDLAELSDDEFGALLTDLSVEAPEAPAAEAEAPAEEDGDPEEGVPFIKDGKTYVVLEGKTFLMSEEAPETPKSEDKAPEAKGEGGADLSETTAKEVRQMRTDTAKERWESERREYVRAGVPPFLLDLAAPVLSDPDTQVIDLSNDEKFNASDTIRKMLNGVKALDLSEEQGHGMDVEIPEKDPLLDAYFEQYA